jgi:SPP1 gp7 family putative phage head morphogenesis protein
LEELHQSTIKKFADGRYHDAPQIGNYAAVFLKLARKMRRKIQKRYNFERLEKLSRKQLEEVNKRGRDQLYKRIAEQTGLDPVRLKETEGLTFRTNALILETAKWAEKLRDETLEFFTANTLRAMSEGKTLDEIVSQFDGMAEKRRRHAEMVARTQIANFNSIMTKTRAQRFGVKKAIWVTSKDERVRRCHAARDGKEFDLSEGLYSSCDGKSLLPGSDYQCRCTYRLVLPDPNDEDE